MPFDKNIHVTCCKTGSIPNISGQYTSCIPKVYKVYTQGIQSVYQSKICGIQVVYQLKSMVYNAEFSVIFWLKYQDISVFLPVQCCLVLF